MFYNRTYFDKCATIVKGSKLNTGFNPVAELVYGRNTSRTLLYFNHEKIKRMVEDKVFPDISQLKHYLRITNAGSLDLSELYKVYASQIDGAEKKRATSFDLIFFLIPEAWDNGKGFDYTKNYFNINFYDEKTYDISQHISEDGVNWYKPANGKKWKNEPDFKKTTDDQLTFFIKADKNGVDVNGDIVTFTYLCCCNGGFANKNLVFKSMYNNLDYPLEIGTPIFFSKGGQICHTEADILKYAQYAKVAVKFPPNDSGINKKYAFRCEYNIDGKLYRSNPYVIPNVSVNETTKRYRQYTCYMGAQGNETITAADLEKFNKFYTYTDELEGYTNTSFGDYLWIAVPSDIKIQEITSGGMEFSLIDEVQYVSNSLGLFKCYRSTNRLDTAYWPIIINTSAEVIEQEIPLKTPQPNTDDGIYSTKTLEEQLQLFESGNESIIIAKQHFDIGCENINVDITDTFNKFITGELANYGIGIAFSPKFEYSESQEENYVGLLTNRTNSFFEPYVETIYTHSIKDDRRNFVLGKLNRLYLYANIGGDLENLDEMPTCSVNDVEYEVKQASKGIYYIEIMLPQNAFSAPTMLYDRWDGIIYQGEHLNAVEMDFTTQPSTSFFQLGYSMPDKAAFTPTAYGINDNEQIKRGDSRKVCFLFKKDYAKDTAVLIDDVEVRLYVMDGTAQVDVIPYIKTNRAFTDTYIMIDTSILIPNTYYMDVRVKYGMEMIEHHNVLHFTIVNEENNKFA